MALIAAAVLIIVLIVLLSSCNKSDKVHEQAVEKQTAVETSVTESPVSAEERSDPAAAAEDPIFSEYYGTWTAVYNEGRGGYMFEAEPHSFTISEYGMTAGTDDAQILPFVNDEYRLGTWYYRETDDGIRVCFNSESEELTKQSMSALYYLFRNGTIYKIVNSTTADTAADPSSLLLPDVELDRDWSFITEYSREAQTEVEDGSDTIPDTVPAQVNGDSEQTEVYNEDETCASVRSALEEEFASSCEDLLAEVMPYSEDGAWISLSFRVDDEKWSELLSSSAQDIFAACGDLLKKTRAIAAETLSGETDVSLNIFSQDADYAEGSPCVVIDLPDKADIDDEPVQFSDGEHPCVYLNYGDYIMVAEENGWINESMLNDEEW